MLLRHFDAQSERLDEPKPLPWKVLLSYSANLHEKYMWKSTKTSNRFHYLCSWQQDWLIDIPLPALHRWGGVINTQRARCSRRAPCLLTVMHSNPVSPLRASATFSSNRSGIKRRSLSTPRIYHQLKSLRGSRILKPVAATSSKIQNKEPRPCRWVDPWHVWSCGDLSKCKPCSACALTLGTGGSCGVRRSGWVILRVRPCIIQHSAWQESVRLTLSSFPLSDIPLVLQSSLNQTTGAITLWADNKHFIPTLRFWLASRVASIVHMQRSADKPKRPASCRWMMFHTCRLSVL